MISDADIKKLAKRNGLERSLLQAAEEFSEASASCLQFVRALHGERDYKAALDSLSEEFADAAIVFTEVTGLLGARFEQSVAESAEKKIDRALTRTRRARR